MERNKIIYVCSPFSGDTKTNKSYARQCTREVISNGYTPITPHLYITEVLNDGVKEERKVGLACGLDLIDVCDEVWSFEDYGVSKGMLIEHIYAMTNDKPIKEVCINGLKQDI